MARIRSHRIILSTTIPQQTSPIFLLSLLLLAAAFSSPFVAVRAEDADVVQESSGKSSSMSSNHENAQLGQEEAAVLMFFCILYAICVSLVAVGLGYFAFLEDKMMRVFLKHGHALQSTVVSADFSRGVTTATTACGGGGGDNDHDGADAVGCYNCGAASDPSCAVANKAAGAADHEQEQQHQNNTPLVVKAEYNVVIEYKVDNNENYKSKVRKQVKALWSDFTKPIPPCIHVVMIEFPIDTASPVPPSVTTSNTSSGNGEHHQHVADRLQLKQHHQCSAITSHLIPILVLDDYPKSAIPLGHVQRACSWRYKLPTMTLVAIMLAFTGFCLLLAADIMYPTSLLSLTGADEEILATASFSRQEVFIMVGLILLGLVLVEVVCVHYCMGAPLSELIRETYLEGSDQGSMSMDETTLSSGDDTYLMV